MRTHTGFSFSHRFTPHRAGVAYFYGTTSHAADDYRTAPATPELQCSPPLHPDHHCATPTNSAIGPRAPRATLPPSSIHATPNSFFADFFSFLPRIGIRRSRIRVSGTLSLTLDPSSPTLSQPTPSTSRRDLQKPPGLHRPRRLPLFSTSYAQHGSDPALGPHQPLSMPPATRQHCTSSPTHPPPHCRLCPSTLTFHSISTDSAPVDEDVNI